jgi:glycosyltransferase involved in cell wall biosynthesis
MGSFDPGGTERQMIELVRRLDRDRWDVQVACLRCTGAWFDRVASTAPCTVFPVGSYRRLPVLDHFRSFVQWCRAGRFAVAHAVDMPSNIFGLPGAALARVPVRIGTRREITAGRSRIELAAQRAGYSCAHLIVANSRAAKAQLHRERVPERKVTVVANGLDIQRFEPRTLPSSPRRVAVVANLRPEKGHEVLIDAAVVVLARFPDAHFEIVGAGSEYERLVTRTAARGVSHAFTFSGHSEDVAGRLAAADLFVLPSRSEAFPNAVVEAMATGLPVVASDVGGIPELVRDGITGLLVPAGDSGQLADRICRLMADGSLAGSLGAAARADVEARYSFERMVSGFERIYLEQLVQRGVVRRPSPELTVTC